MATVCEEDTEFVLLPKLDADEPRRPMCLFVTNEIDPLPSLVENAPPCGRAVVAHGPKQLRAEAYREWWRFA